MSKKEKKSLFQRLTKLFKTGSVVRRKERGLDTTLAAPDKTSSGTLLFQKTMSPTYSAITSTAYNIAERLQRYNDFNAMEMTPELSAALDLYADETVASDDKGQVLHVYSNNEKIRETLVHLFDDVLNVEFNLRSWTRNLVKYGDLFLYVDVSPEYGVQHAFPIPVNEIEREENYDRDDPFAIRFKWVTGNKVLQNWEIAHFRLLGNDMFLPYGSSVLEPARRIWRQLILIEDAMLVYRVVRAPERRVFYIDVANVPTTDVKNYVEDQKRALKTQPVADGATGATDVRYNPMSILEDYYIPIRGPETGTKIETLVGGQNTAAIEDVAYIQKKMFAALKVPRAYLGYDESLSSKACLVASTKIPLLNGQTRSIQDVSQMFIDQPDRRDIFVHSWDHETKKIVPARVKRAWKTKKVTELYEVTIDDNTIVQCKENRPFMLRDGTYKRADDLVVGQSLMPLYRKVSVSKANRGEDYLHGYTQVRQVDRDRWDYAHRLAGEWKYGRAHVTRKSVFHHVDFNKSNNSPDNLLWMKDGQVHRAFHALMNKVHKTYVGKGNPRYNHDITWENLVEVAKIACYRRDLEVVLNCGTRVLIRLMKENDHTYQTFANSFMPKAIASHRSAGRLATTPSTDTKVLVEKVTQAIQEGMLSKVPLASRFDVPVSLIEFCATQAGFQSWHEFRDDVIGLSKEKLDAAIRKTSSYDELRLLYPSVKPERMRRAIQNCFGTSYKHVRSNSWNNHSVISIRVIHLDSPVPVYDLEVEGTHNFAIATSEDDYNGIFVHNSLSQEDIRFSRSIAVIQKTITAELNKLACVHLYAHGFDGPDLENFTLRLSNPSTVAQQQKLELWRTKFEIAGSLPEGMGSTNFVQTHVWGLTDEEKREIREQQVEEAKFRASIESVVAASSPEGAPAEGGLFGGGETGLGGGGEAGGEEGGEVAGGEETPPPETAGEEPPEDDPVEDDDVELLLSGDDDGDFMPLTLEDDKDDRIVKPMNQLDRALYNRSRRRTHGASKTFIPDHNEMTKPERDVHDVGWMKSVARDPLEIGRA